MKKTLSMLLAVVLLFSLAACGVKENETTAPTTTAAPAVHMNIATLKGPTGMGMAKMMSDEKDNSNYTFTLSSDPTEISTGIINGSFDIAACPLNLASVLFNKTKGAVTLLAINTEGVLYIMENGNTVNSIKDLKGKKIYATGQGATPEYVLNYLLEQNNIKDSVEIEYKTEHAELATLAVGNKVSLCMLPEPNVTTVLSKNSEFRIAVDMTKEFEAASGVSLAMGCIIVRNEFLQNNKDAVNSFLNEYKASVEYVNANIDASSELIASLGIVPASAVAKKALPNCNIVFITGDEMKKTAQKNFEILYNSNPASVGGNLPTDGFYYNY